MSPDAVLIRGARIVDGTGRPAETGDVLIVGSRIAQLGGHVEPPVGTDAIDADGLAVCPGFIDMHAHSDLAVLRDKQLLAKVSQGVTTEVLGQDGLSYAPTSDQTMAVVREQIAAWNGNPADLDFSWRTVRDYLDRVDEGAAVNVAYLLPQGTIRMAAVGDDDRRATSDELARMRGLVAAGMRDGAFGMSSGLTYAPGMFADADELVALCSVVAEHGGYYSPHHRSYGRDALGAYAEMIDVARRSGCALHFAHTTMNFAVNKGRAPELIELIDAALGEGVDITFDSYPYLPGSTSLAALLPGWAASGGPAAILRRLCDDAARERIRYALEVTGSEGCHGVPMDWSTIEVAGVQHPELADRVGKTIAELAAQADMEPAAIYFELLRADELGTLILQHVGDENNVRMLMRHRSHCGGSDGLLTGTKPHPRTWGTFPRYLGHYVRDEQVLGLEEAVAHLTSRPARRLGLSDRGVLRTGNVADLVLFDPDTVADTATFARPRSAATGIPWVFVAGRPVIADSLRTAETPGVALRKAAA